MNIYRCYQNQTQSHRQKTEILVQKYLIKSSDGRSPNFAGQFSEHLVFGSPVTDSWVLMSFSSVV